MQLLAVELYGHRQEQRVGPGGRLPDTLLALEAGTEFIVILGGLGVVVPFKPLLRFEGFVDQQELAGDALRSQGEPILIAGTVQKECHLKLGGSFRRPGIKPERLHAECLAGLHCRG